MKFYKNAILAFFLYRVGNLLLRRSIVKVKEDSFGFCGNLGRWKFVPDVFGANICIQNRNRTYVRFVLRSWLRSWLRPGWDIHSLSAQCIHLWPHPSARLIRNYNGQHEILILFYTRNNYNIKFAQLKDITPWHFLTAT